MPAKRPGGFVALCVLLLWSLIGDLSTWPPVVTGCSGGGGPTGWFDRVSIAVLLAGPFGAVPALVGVWGMRRWAALAFGAWAALTALKGALLLFLIGGLGGVRGPTWLALGALWAAGAGVLFVLWRYVRRVIAA